VAHVSFPKILSVRIRAVRQNQRISNAMFAIIHLLALAALLDGRLVAGDANGRLHRLEIIT
jgi:hypothetical protein